MQTLTFYWPLVKRCFEFSARNSFPRSKESSICIYNLIILKNWLATRTYKMLFLSPSLSLCLSLSLGLYLSECLCSCFCGVASFPLQLLTLWLTNADTRDNIRVSFYIQAMVFRVPPGATSRCLEPRLIRSARVEHSVCATRNELVEREWRIKRKGGREKGREGAVLPPSRMANIVGGFIAARCKLQFATEYGLCGPMYNRTESRKRQDVCELPARGGCGESRSRPIGKLFSQLSREKRGGNQRASIHGTINIRRVYVCKLIYAEPPESTVIRESFG